MELSTRQMSASNYLRLFLIIAFPIQGWSFLVSFWNFQDVVERSANLMDGIAYVSYSMLTAFLESLILFFFIMLLGFLIPKSYDEEKRVVLLSLIGFSTVFWLFIEQLYALMESNQPGITVDFITQFAHPYRITILLLAILLGLIALSLAFPFFLIKRYPRFTSAVQNLLARIVPLSALYIFLNVLGIIIVAYRNLAG